MKVRFKKEVTEMFGKTKESDAELVAEERRQSETILQKIVDGAHSRAEQRNIATTNLIVDRLDKLITQLQRDTETGWTAMCHELKEAISAQHGAMWDSCLQSLDALMAKKYTVGHSKNYIDEQVALIRKHFTAKVEDLEDKTTLAIANTELALKQGAHLAGRVQVMSEFIEEMYPLFERTPAEDGYELDSTHVEDLSGEIALLKKEDRPFKIIVPPKPAGKLTLPVAQKRPKP